MEAVESSLKQMAVNVAAVHENAVPGLATWGQSDLDEKQRRWDALSRQVRRKGQGVVVLTFVRRVSGSMEKGD